MATRGGTGSNAGRIGWSVGRADWLDDPSSKVSRYWRSIEYGNNEWPKGRMAGLWGNTPGPNSRPGNFRTGDLDAFSGGGNQKFVPFFSKRGDDQSKAAVGALMYYFGVTRSSGLRNAQNLSEITKTTSWDEGDHKRPAKDKKGRLTGKMESRGSGPAEQKRALFMLIQSASQGKKVPFVVGDFSKRIEARGFYAQALRRFDPVEEEIKVLRQLYTKIIGGVDPTSSYGRGKMRALAAYQGQTKPRTGPTGGKNPVTQSNVRERMGSYGGIVTIAAGVMTQDYLRTGTGFSVRQEDARQANSEMARRFQAVVVSLMRAQPAARRPTGDLIRAHDDPRNIYPDV